MCSTSSSSSSWLASSDAPTRKRRRRQALGDTRPDSAAGGTSVTCDWKRACAMRSGHSRTAWPVVKRQAVRSPGCRRELITLPRGTAGPAASAGSSRSGSSCAISIDGVGAR